MEDMSHDFWLKSIWIQVNRMLRRNFLSDYSTVLAHVCVMHP
jgi:hypothetical protein